MKIKIVQGKYHQDYICPICENYKAPWMEIRAKGWGKAQVARKMVREHIQSVHPNQKIQRQNEEEMSK